MHTFEIQSVRIYVLCLHCTPWAKTFLAVLVYYRPCITWRLGSSKEAWSAHQQSESLDFHGREGAHMHRYDQLESVGKAGNEHEAFMKAKLAGMLRT